MSKRDTFVLKASYFSAFRHKLNFEQKGRLLEAIYAYHLGEDYQPLLNDAAVIIHTRLFIMRRRRHTAHLNDHTAVFFGSRYHAVNKRIDHSRRQDGKINIDLLYTKLLNQDANPSYPDGVTVYLFKNNEVLKQQYFGPSTTQEVTGDLSTYGVSVNAGKTIDLSANIDVVIVFTVGKNTSPKPFG